MNQVNEKIDVKKASCREMYMEDLLYLLGVRQTGITDVLASWGARGFTSDKNHTMFRMRVSGMHHKGYVWIFLSFLDLFDVYLTKLDGTIKKVETGLYCDMLTEWIDNNIERMPDYTH